MVELDLGIYSRHILLGAHRLALELEDEVDVIGKPE